ncbi:MAG: MFS transporter [Rhizobiaceae bacterium]
MDMRLAWLAVGTFTISSVGFAFSGLLPVISADMNISIATAGYVLIAYALAYAVGAPVLSAFGGALDRRWLLCGALLAFVAGNGLAGSSGTFSWLIMAQVMMGAAAGLFVATAQATAVAIAGPDHRARAIAIVYAGTAFAVAFGSPLGSLFAALWGWRVTFLAATIVGLVCAAVLWLRLPKDMVGTKLTLGERLAVVVRPGIGSSLLVTLIYLAGGFCVVAYLGPIATEGAGLSQLAIPAVLLAFGIGAVIGNTAGGYLSDRIGATSVVKMSLAASIVLSIAMAVGLKVLPAAVAGPFLIGVMIVWGSVGWAFNPAQGSRLAAYAPEAVQVTLSANVSALYVGIALGTTIGGQVLEFASPADLGLVAAIFPALGLAIVYASAPAPVRAAKMPAE